MTPRRAQRLTLFGAAVVIGVELLALVSGDDPLWSAAAMGQVMVVVAAAGVLVIMLAAQRGRSPWIGLTVAMAALAAAGATMTFAAGSHRNVDIVLWLAICGASIGAVFEARARRRHASAYDRRA